MCNYCNCKSELDSVADKWILDDSCETIKGFIQPGLCVLPKEREIVFNVHDESYKEVYIKHIPIKYCPMCGREL